MGPGNRGSLDGPEWGRSDGRRRRRDAESSLFRTLLDQTETAIFATDAEGRYLYKSDLNVDIDPSRAVSRTEVEAKPEYLRETAETDWEDDEIRGLVGIRTDTTREKLAEKRLRRQADQVDRFARQVTHNVRTPLQMADSALDRARAGDETALDAVEQRLHETETVVDDLHLVSADDTARSRSDSSSVATRRRRPARRRSPRSVPANSRSDPDCPALRWRFRSPRWMRPERFRIAP